ncbi:winged helix-turn-helix domain-containing protein [Enterococcus sp. AZ126]|uniref:winged helix-turn-helix domain-containing protein n=1 Tax=Enterococcus sp. AZ126 TaxID=2774635 RepID=UPI003F1FFB18
MLTLGILGIDSAMYQTLEKKFKSEVYKLIKVEKKEQLEQIDGLILSMDEKKQMSVIIDWLLTCQKTPSVFVWIFSTIPLDYEEDVLLGLGANDVVMTKSRESNLVQVVKNTFSRLEYSNKTRKRSIDHQIINDKNQSILVNGMEQPLTRKEFQIFSLLYEHKNVSLSYENLLNRLWPNADENELYRLANIIFHLRKKIKDSDEYAIKTVRSKGYMLQTKEN